MTRTLELHVLSSEEGVWCEPCNLSTAVRIRWALADSDTLEIWFTGGHIQCGLCNECRVEK